MNDDAGVERERRLSNFPAEEVERIGAVNHLHMVPVRSEEVREGRGENRISTEMHGREETIQQAKAHVEVSVSLEET